MNNLDKTHKTRYIISMKQYDALALFSGGLDSILAARLMLEQGKKILCLHFTTPFFGNAHAVPHWEKKYGLEILAINVDTQYIKMLIQGGDHGYGSTLNPCIDCKILMMRHAKKLMPEYGAKFLISGEVLGQRPMSQRRDTLNIIHNDADVKDILLRPLCAKHMTPLPIELSDEVDRTKLLGFSGRGRKDQIALAKHFGIKDFPTAAGGCKLTEKENARRYWTLIKNIHNPSPNDFHLSNAGRQFWNGNHWLCIGRNQADNEKMLIHNIESDYFFQMANFPGPLGIGRSGGARPASTDLLDQSSSTWNDKELNRAASHFAIYANKAVQHAQNTGEQVDVRISHNGQSRIMQITPCRDPDFTEDAWDDVKEEIYSLRKKL